MSFRGMGAQLPFGYFRTRPKQVVEGRESGKETRFKERKALRFGSSLTTNLLCGLGQTTSLL